jgi:uncharacterized OB-fold protein
MATMYQERPIPAPELNPGDEPYFEAASTGKLLIKQCTACAKVFFYPRPLCPFCLSDRTEWVEASGRGTVYTFSVTRRAGPIPYAIAFVTLEEGVTMMTNIVDCDLDEIRIGQPVKVVFKQTEGEWKVPCFAPA